MLEEILVIIGVIISLWIIFMVLAPLIIITENFLEDRIRKTKTSKKIAKKLKGKTKLKTLRNTYDYINDHFYGQGHQLDYITPPEFFDLGIATRLLLKNKRFLWCSNQIAILISLLINTDHFKKEDIRLKWALGKNLVTHFYVEVQLGNKKIKVDSFYNIFKHIR